MADFQKWTSLATRVHDPSAKLPRVSAVDQVSRAKPGTVSRVFNLGSGPDAAPGYGAHNAPLVTSDVSMVTIFEQGLWRRSPQFTAATVEERKWLLAADRIRERIDTLNRSKKRCYRLYDRRVDGEDGPGVRCAGLEVAPSKPAKKAAPSGKVQKKSKRQLLADELAVLTLFVDAAESRLVPFFVGVPYVFVCGFNPGDYMYVVGDQIALIIERKADSDLSGSMFPSHKGRNVPAERRFSAQRDRLSRLDLHPSRVMYLRERDRPDVLFTSDCPQGAPGMWKPAVMEGAMTNMEWREGMRVRETRGVAHTVFLLYRNVLSLLEKGCEYITALRQEGEPGRASQAVPSSVGRLTPYRTAPVHVSEDEYKGGRPGANVTERNYFEACMRGVPKAGAGVAAALLSEFGSMGGLFRRCRELDNASVECEDMLAKLEWSAENPDLVAARGGASSSLHRIGPALAKKIIGLLDLEPLASSEALSEGEGSEAYESDEEAELELPVWSKRKPNLPADEAEWVPPKPTSSSSSSSSRVKPTQKRSLDSLSARPAKVRKL